MLFEFLWTFWLQIYTKFVNLNFPPLCIFLLQIIYLWRILYLHLNCSKGLKIAFKRVETMLLATTTTTKRIPHAPNREFCIPFVVRLYLYNNIISPYSTNIIPYGVLCVLTNNHIHACIELHVCIYIYIYMHVCMHALNYISLKCSHKMRATNT